MEFLSNSSNAVAAFLIFAPAIFFIIMSTRHDKKGWDVLYFVFYGLLVAAIATFTNEDPFFFGIYYIGMFPIAKFFQKAVAAAKMEDNKQ